MKIIFFFDVMLFIVNALLAHRKWKQRKYFLAGIHIVAVAGFGYVIINQLTH